MGNDKVSLPMEEMKGFVLASTSEPCTIEGATLGGLMNIFFHVQDFIRDYFVEEYHSVNAILVALKPKRRIESIKLRKSLVVNGEGVLEIVPNVEVTFGEVGSDTLRDAQVTLDDSLSIVDHLDVFPKEVSVKTRFALLEVMDCLMSELPHLLANNLEDYAQ